MNKRLLTLAHRRRGLIETIEAQRIEMAEIALHWEKPLAMVDKGLKGLRLIQRHPLLMGGGTAALLAVRRTGIFGLAQKGVRLIYLYPLVLSLGSKALSAITRASVRSANTTSNNQ
ncbi:MAG: YqjK-like family protein [Gallionella sp.]